MAEIVNSICELTQFMTEAFPNHVIAMEQVIQHVLCIPERGLVMQLDGLWGGDKDFQFQIDRISDSGGATELNLCKGCGGLQVFLNKALVAHKSKMQGSVSLSMAEGELIAACEVAQIMLFSMQVLEDIGLCVKKPMVLQGLQRGARPYIWMEHQWIDKTWISSGLFPA